MASGATYKENKDKYCVNVDNSVFEMTEEERKSAREGSVTPMSISIKDIVDAVNGETGAIISGMMVYIVLIGILVLFSLVSLVIFLIYCCCCDKQASNEGKAKCYWYISFGILIAYAILMILMLVYISKI